MASIIVDLSDDIKKLQSLKEEIQQIKNELKDINVKVDIDIAEGLETQLKSLTTQYDALVQKMAEAEAKIAESTARINQSAETIIKAQEQVAKAATGGTSTTANQAETASVQAQAKAYDELAAEIDAVMGTRTQNIRRMLEEQNAIRLINEEIKKLTKSQSGNSTLSAAQQNRLTQLNASLLQHKTALSELRQNLNNSFKLDNAAATSMNALSQSLSRMRMAYRELTEEERNSPFGQELLASIQQTDAKIKELDASIGNHQRNVGNYASGWNGLNMSIQQIGRELPSLAVGMNTFFLAIFNNLPILADEIKRAKNEYNALKAAGQQATPVWKQIVSSLLSWQTALTVGITLLTLYGAEIVNWVGNLFKAKDGTAEFKKALKSLNETISSVEGNISSELKNLRELNLRLREAEKGSEEWNSIKNKMVTNYSKYLSSIDSEIEKTGYLADSYDKLAENIRKAAAVRGFTEAKEKEDEEYIKKRQETIEKVYEAFIKDYGDEKGYEMHQKWMSLLDSGDVISVKNQRLFAKTETGLSENANSLLIDLRELEDARNKALEKYRKIYGLSEGTEDNLPSDSIKAMQASIAARREALEELSTSSAEYLKLKAEIEADEKKLADLSKTQEKSDKEADKQLQSQQKASDLLIALRRQNQQSELSLMEEGADKKLAQIDADYDAQKTEIEKKARELAKANKKAGITGTNDNGLTTEQQEEIDRANQLNTDNRIKQTEEIYKAEVTAMRDYLKQYGTYQQQKLAIAEEYAEKIRKAGSEGERLTLERQRDAALQQVEISAIQKNIDWGSVFGEFGTMFKAQLQPTIDQLRQIAQSDAFRQSSLEDQQLLYELIAKLEQSNTVWDGDIFRRVSDDMNAYQTAMQNYIAAQERERIATEKLAKAKEELEEAERTGGDVETAQVKVDLAAAMLSGAAGEVQQFGTQVQETTASLQSSSQQAVNMFQDLKSGLQGLASGSLSGIGQGIMQLDKLFNNGELTKKAGNALAEGFQSLFGDSNVTQALSDALGNSGMAGELIAGVLSILDLIAEEGLSGIVSGLIDTIYGVVNSLLEDALNFKITREAGKSLINGMSSLLDTITFGGFSSWIGAGDSDSTLADDIERLTQANKDLEQAIQNLSDKLDDAAVADASEIYEQQKSYLEQAMANTQELMQRAGANYSNGVFGIGGSHSSNYKIDKAMSSSDWQRISDIVGRTIDSAADFWTLTSEEMWNVATDAADLYSKIKSYADDGYNDTAQYMDEYIQYWIELSELEESLYEKLTSVSFDTVRDDFKSALLDMESDTEDFVENFEEMMQEAIIESLMTSTYDALLQNWYNQFAEAMSDGTMTTAERNELKSQWDDIVSQALAEREELMELFGWTSSSSSSQQSGSYRAFGTEMTQEQGTEISGRLTTLAESNYRLESETALQTAAITELSTSVLELASAARSTGDTSDETRSILASSYLELQEINENTGSSARYLKDIKADIAVVKQNTGRI